MGLIHNGAAYRQEGLSGWAQVRRPAQERVVAGVARAIADKLDVTPLAARSALVALSFVGGAGMAVYMCGWLCLAPEGSDQPIFKAALADHRTLGLVAAAASILAALMVALGALGPTLLLGALSPGLVSLAALVAVWRHAGPADEAAARHLGSLLSGAGPATVPAGRRLVLSGTRLLIGAALVALGTSTLLAPRHFNGADITVALAAAGTMAGFSLILAPWWLRLGRQLAAERRQLARVEERAEMAAHLHDSVLQTLALIQRSAGDAQQVQRLARSQERQLRSWLFDKSGPGDEEGTRSLSAALLGLQQEVESDHGLRADVVTVGDAEVDERLGALVAATREAVVNAAKWSGADVVSIYAEVEAGTVSVFVRDRGRGFEPGKVAPDRKGLSESVYARMRRHGGTSSVRSAPGEGTEVALTMPGLPS